MIKARHSFRRVTLILLSLVLLASLSQAAPLDQVKIESGQLKGVIAKDVVSFKGIPFAAPPVGELRWRPPQPVTLWKGVRPAAEYGADCMQLPFPSDAAPLGTPPAEDCLYVNVWGPAQRSSAKLPVLVWFYGGGFVNGGSSPAVYDGSQFARRGLIFVSFNYRLGRFGFFAHPALSKEHPGEWRGNYGYMDQIAALKWIQRNIAAFGGDPGNVTIFGESAGGGSVFTMLISPQTTGLFHRAIVQSGGGRDSLMGPRYVDKRAGDTPSAEEVGVEFAKTAGITGTDAAALAALRKLPAETVVGGMNMASMHLARATHSGPMIDGEIVRESPQSALAAGRYAKVPFIIGANNVDIGFPRGTTMDEVLAPFGAEREKAKAAYDPANTGDARLVGYLIASDQMMIEPARFVARMFAAAGLPAYEYRFSYVAESKRKEMPGAFHATEIPYIFNTIDAVYGDKLTPNDRALAEKANAYWASFAISGNPNGPGRPNWPLYSKDSDVLLNFTNDGPVAQPDPWKTRLDLVEKLAK